MRGKDITALSPEKAIEEIMGCYSPEIQQIAKGIQCLIETFLSNPVISVDGADIGFGFGTGYKGLIFVITPFPSYVRLGIFGGAALEDPAGLMEGRGHVHRHIKIRDLQVLENPALTELMKDAVKKKTELIGRVKF